MKNASAIDNLTGHLLKRWPAHRKFVETAFESRPPEVMAVTNHLAECILKLVADDENGLDVLCDDYRFLCENIVLPEEIYFRRHGAYRLSSFAAAEAECYANAPFMARYMNGLLLSNVLWINHANAFASFVNDYLPRLPNGARHLEIGPGHGMFLYFAAIDSKVESVTGWDISPTSVAKTRHALRLLGTPREPTLTLRNLFDTESVCEADLFDSVAMSEILEHLEDPVAALKAAARQIRPGGRVFINVPANSPAPDHIFLFTDLDHAVRIVEQGGFEVESSAAFPMVGVTLKQAQKHRLSVSCVIVGRKS